jgi:hypothetical protein
VGQSRRWDNPTVAVAESPSLRLRVAHVLGRPWFLWTLAAVFAGRDLVLSALSPGRPDTGTFWSAGRLLLHRPSSLYDQSSQWLARYHLNPLPGDIQGFISPPPVAYLLAPYGLLPRFAGVELWTLTDALLLLAGLWLLDRQLGLSGSRRAAYWLLAFFFPPLFAEVDAGQVGGVLVFLAAASSSLYGARPRLAGALAGLAGSVKFYPAAMALGAGGRRRTAYWLAAGSTMAGVLFLSFLPIGLDKVSLYFSGVLLPTLSPPLQDCGVVSTPSMISRYVGGVSWALPSADGSTLLREQVPWSFPLAAQVLSFLVPVILLGLTWWACRRSGYAAPYGLLLGFALGAVVPGTAFPYQLLALLPVTLVVLMRCIEDRAAAPILLMVAGLALFIKAPCDTPIANLWTAGALLILAVCLWQARRFQPTTRPGDRQSSV